MTKQTDHGEAASETSALAGSDQPPGWCWTELGHLGAFINGDRGPNYPSRSAFVETGIPFVNAGHLNGGAIGLSAMNYITRDRFDLLRSGKINNGDVLYCLRGSLGKAAIVSNLREGAIASSLLIIRPYGATAAPYVYAYLTSPLGRRMIKLYDNGTAQPNLSGRNVGRFLVPIAPLPEQRRIVAAIESYFTRLDDAVATLERTERKLKRYRASVLKSAVEGRLVPTEASLARAEGRDYEPASVLLERILVERRRRWEEAELAKLKAKGKPPTNDKWKAKYKEPVAPGTTDLPDLPEGWCWATIDQAAEEVRYGSSSKTSKTRQDGVPVLRMGNIVEGVLDFSDLKFLPEGHDEFPSLLLRAGDVLFNRTNSAELVGKTAVFHHHADACSFASYLIRVRLLHGVQPEYVARFINSYAGRRWIASVVSQQVGQANVNGTKLRACVLPLPPAAEQARINVEADRLMSLAFAAQDAVATNLRRCLRLRQSVLKWAFEGKLAEQDANDEPASVLLERIKSEREDAATAKKNNRRGRKKKGVA